MALTIATVLYVSVTVCVCVRARALKYVCVFVNIYYLFFNVFSYTHRFNIICDIFENYLFLTIQCRVNENYHLLLFIFQIQSLLNRPIYKRILQLTC